MMSMKNSHECFGHQDYHDFDDNHDHTKISSYKIEYTLQVVD